MNLEDKRRAIRPLLNELRPADGMASYYAFEHTDSRTSIVIDESLEQPTGYVAISQTGMDLFRPLITLRLDTNDLPGSSALIYRALPEGADVLGQAPADYEPLLRALFDLTRIDTLQLFVRNRAIDGPEINVLVTTERGANGLPRVALRQPLGPGGELVTVASAVMNWQSTRFAEIGVNTLPGYQRRGYGRTVVWALAQQIILSGRRPLYAADVENTASIRLASSLGFEDTGARFVMLEGRLRPKPAGL